ncbi:hypothetical protein KY325_00815 [Candidatus Woesearchaeota archaeon]|nr:hypothetical protein [Candidatus Woesearchaeota archaeon]MBW3017681.1 hypothetical protein [Candidatus Woesearchaeota archaeon]
MVLKDYTLDYSKEDYKRTIVTLLKLGKERLMQLAEKFNVVFTVRPEKLRPIDYADSLMADVPKDALLEELSRIERS